MVQVAAALFEAETVEPLLLARRAQRDDAEHLRLAASEEPRAVRAGQESHLAGDGANVGERAAIGPDAAIEDLRADVLLELFLERQGDFLEAIGIFRRELGEQLRLDGVELGLALRLVRIVGGDLEARAHEGGHVRAQLLIGDRRRELLLGLARRLHQLFLHLDEALDGIVARADGGDHGLFGQLLGARFDHHDGIGGGGDDQVELAVHELRLGRIDDDLIVNVAHAHGTYRPHEGDRRNGERGGGGGDADDVWVVLQVGGEHGDDDLYVVAIALGEERANGAIGEARGQDRVFGRASLTLDEPARDLAGGVEPLLDVDGQREEINALTGLAAGSGGGQHYCVAVTQEHGPAGLLRDSAGLDTHDPAADDGLKPMNHISSGRSLAPRLWTSGEWSRVTEDHGIDE